MAFGKSQTDGKSRHGSRIGVIMLQNWPTRSRRDPVLLVEIRLQVRLDPFCRLWRLHHAGSESISRYDLRHASANTRLSVLSLSAFLVFSFEPNRREQEGKRQKKKEEKKNERSGIVWPTHRGALYANTARRRDISDFTPTGVFHFFHVDRAIRVARSLHK